MRRQCNVSSHSVLTVYQLGDDRRHRLVVGLARLEQVTIAVEGLRDGRMPHEHLDTFWSETLFDPQGGTGMTQGVQGIFGVGLAVTHHRDACRQLDRPENSREE